ncbi:c-type cytochrome biogenesis protein CcmI [Rhodobacter calidifons]|uniref:C-type cytochrome biogenesis protein CcmI n=1 Tax=Rhodobacter calidifons TaxID=2715277 RepID=A0ABX0GAP8_9RHOB|nr:c-type cytochrome biogenesis protein CcmI [Rhodobacter calidifons]NHB78341.1 c-type cytochrome biogenesis protein CcmI [Rhodobacter calidifons]
MTGWIFWAVAVTLGALVASVLVAALRRVPAAAPQDDLGADLSVYRDQFAEIERDLARGTIGPDEAARLRAEVGKRLLEVDRARARSAAAARPAGATGPGRVASMPAVAAVIVAVILPGGIAAYAWLGAPGYPDMALSARLAALDAGLASRPAQAEELERIGRPRDAAADQALVVELAGVTDADTLRARFRTAFESGDFHAAVRVQERLVALRGSAADTSDHANLALALVAEAGGYVSPEAEAALRASLRADMTNELARYLVGEMFVQGGRFDQAFRFWRPLAENGNPSAPWTASIRERIGQVAELAGVRYAAPQAPGPTASDIAAAGGMSPEDGQAMIEGMVAQLSDRLATEGGTVEEWNRLIRSLAVLERLAEAQTIYDEAKAQFAGRPAELSFLRLAAVESGLNP